MCHSAYLTLSRYSALFELNTPPSPGAVSLEETDRETENAGEGEETPRRRSSSRHRPQSHALLGSFEESALNGRLEPVSTVHGFSAELGASGSFCPKHQKLPVTVFFYTLGDNDKVSTPYLVRIRGIYVAIVFVGKFSLLFYTRILCRLTLTWRRKATRYREAVPSK